MDIIKYLLDATFRANPDYELVLFDRLEAHEQKRLAELLQDAEFYGLLRPRVPGLTVKSVSRDVALLLYSLATPGRLPAYARTLLGERANETLAQLVLDQVLQIQSGTDFVCGPRARDAIDAANAADLVGDGVLARLSLQALRYGQELRIDDDAALARRLYCYNRLPATLRWQRRLPTRAEVARFLGLDDGAVPEILQRNWISLSGTNDEPWLAWTRRTAERNGGHAAHKLYVSPPPDHLQQALAALLGVLSETGAQSFKVGARLEGLLRPDKLVIYFAQHDEMRAAADRIDQALSGMPAHGVPFTAPLDAAGLLSWGLDPPTQERLLPYRGRSWRSWIAGELAVALNAARREPIAGTEPWQFALRKLRLRGVDTVTWTPAAGFWTAPGTPAQ